MIGLALVLASSCTHSMAGLIVTEGFMFGFGQATIFHSAATLPSAYFLRRRNLATGIVYAGAGVGGAMWSVIVAQMIERIGMPWALRVLGFIFWVINIPCAWRLRGRSKLVPFKFLHFKEKKPRKSTQGSGATTTSAAKENDETTDDGERKTARIVDWSLFKDVRYVLLFIAGAVIVFPLFVPPFFLPLFGTSLGMSATASSAMLAGYNLASAFGRIAFGLGADAVLGSVNSLLVCFSSVAISTLLIWPLASSVAPLALFAVINGFSAGGFFSLIPGVLSSLLGSKRMPVAFSMLVSVWAPGYFLGSPVAGYLLQAVGGPSQGYQAFRPAIFYAGSLATVSSLLVAGIRWKEGGSWRRKV